MSAALNILGIGTSICQQLLFALRDVPQELSQFAPFELLYGRTMREPMSILRQMWTGEQINCNVKCDYQYVINLAIKINVNCQIATEIKSTAKNRHTHFYTRNTRVFTIVGSCVLLLLPVQRNKLEVTWQETLQGH